MPIAWPTSQHLLSMFTTRPRAMHRPMTIRYVENKVDSPVGTPRSNRA